MPIEGLCSAKVICMTFIEGEPLSAAVSPGNAKFSMTSFECLSGIFEHLLASFGFQIFHLGVFHSDPHPGNILLCDLQELALIDFGQVKVLPDRTRILFAHLIVSLAEESEDLFSILEALKIEFTVFDKRLIRTISYILFDTRMDIPEAKMSPLDSDFPAELLGVRISSIPSDVFMLIRVVAIFRGIFAAVNIDLHAREIWRESARQAILTSEQKFAFEKQAPGTYAGSVEQLRLLQAWLSEQNLPCEREHVLSFAKAKLFSVKDVKLAVISADQVALRTAFSHFSAKDELRCIEALSRDPG